jgi:Fe-S-cluster containining protein
MDSTIPLNQEKITRFPWYKEGLAFACTQCGKCCTGEPGYVWVSDEEITQMADFLKISLADFRRLYLRRLHNRYLLVEKKSQNHSCVFFKENKCSVYQARPIQCRTYPFWPENVASKESWQEAARHCEGINDQAALVNYNEIQNLVEQS